MLRLQLAGIALAALTAGPALAQTAAPKPPPSAIPEKIAPGAKPAGPTENLSDKLKQSGGVIAPKEVDKGIEKPAPQTGDPNVVPPPAANPDAPQAK